MKRGVVVLAIVAAAPLAAACVLELSPGLGLATCDRATARAGSRDGLRVGERSGRS